MSKQKWLKEHVEELGFTLVCVTSSNFIVHRDCNIYEICGDCIEKVYPRNKVFNHMGKKQCGRFFELWKQYREM